MDTNPGSTTIIFGRTLAEVKTTFINRFLHKIPKEAYDYRISEQKIIWKLNPLVTPNGNVVNSVLYFGHLSEPGDELLYRGREFDHELFDEGTLFYPEMITYLITRLRNSQPLLCPNRLVRFSAASNPGGPSHDLFKRWFITKDFKKTELEALAAMGITPEDFVFIPAKHSDNKYLDKAYAGQLMMQDEVTRRQLLEGDWDAVSGLFFNQFQRSLHVVRPYDIPDNWIRVRGIDFGTADPYVSLWAAMPPDLSKVVIYREYYERNKTAIENIAEVKSLSGSEKYRYSVIDSAVFSQTGFGESIGQIHLRKGLMVIPANKQRVQGWAVTKSWMAIDPQGKPRLEIFDSCPNLIREIMGAVALTDNPDDINSRSSDHALDAMRYLLMSIRMAAPRGPSSDADPAAKLARLAFETRNQRNYH